MEQQKRAIRGDQKKKGKKPKIGESSRWAPMMESDPSIIIVSLVREVGQAEVTKTATRAISLSVVLAMAAFGVVQGSGSYGSHGLTRSLEKCPA